jgi:anti-anti-sigma factor
MLLALQGELDLASAPLAAEELRRAEESHSLIVLDLQELTFMDSTGLHMALTADRRARAEGRRLVLVGVQPQVRRLLELTQCDAQLTILEDPTDLRG